MKIKQILILNLAISLTIIALFGYFAVIENKNFQEESIIQNSETLATELMDKIDREVYEVILDARVQSHDLITQEVLATSNEEFDRMDNVTQYIKENEWSGLPIGSENAKLREISDNALSRELREKLDYIDGAYGFKVYGELFITNKYGVNVGQTGRTTDYFQADEIWWQNAAQNGLYVEDVSYDNSSGMYAMTVSVRIEDENGNFEGVLKTVYSIEGITNIMESLKKSGIHGEHNSMDIELATKDGNIIYADDHDFLQPLPQEVLEIFFEERNGFNHTHSYSSLKKEHGEEHLFVHVHSTGHDEYKGVGWVLIIEHEAKEIFRPVQEFLYGFAAIWIIVSLLTVLSSIWVYITISKPIFRLKTSVIDYGKGTSDKIRPINTEDEIGDLSKTFSQMARDLKESRKKIELANKELERKVKARTRSLEEKNKELAKTLKLTIGRELEMIRLKKRIKELENE